MKLRIGISSIQGGLSFFLLSIVALLEFVQVLLRYVFRAPLMGIEELLIFPTIWLFFIGSANASLEKTQLNIDLIDVIVKSQKIIKISRIIKEVISLVINVWLIYWAYQYFLYSFRGGRESATLYIPLFYAESAFLIGFFIMGLYSLRDVIYITKLK